MRVSSSGLPNSRAGAGRSGTAALLSGPGRSGASSVAGGTSGGVRIGGVTCAQTDAPHSSKAQQHRPQPFACTIFFILAPLLVQTLAGMVSVDVKFGT